MNGRFARAAQGESACPFTRMYLVVEPGAPGNRTDRFRVVDESVYRKSVERGSHTYVFASYATREAAEARRDRLNEPLYPPAVGPEVDGPVTTPATDAELAQAERWARERHGFPGRMRFDLPSVNVPHVYAPFPALLPEDKEQE